MAKKEEPIPEIEKLKSFKERSGWSYNKMSSLMGIHSQTIYFWLRGSYRPSSLALEKIRHFLDTYAY